MYFNKNEMPILKPARGKKASVEHILPQHFNFEKNHVKLIDLGFDVSKYSSVSYELCNNPKDCSYKTENQLFLSDNRNGICECGYQKEIKTLKNSH